MVRCGVCPKILLITSLICLSETRASTIYTVTDLGSLGGNSAALALNDSGLAVGYSVSERGDLSATSFRDHTASALGFDGQANAVNNNGVVAGASWSSGHAQAVTWTDGQLVNLPGLGGSASYASSINSFGQVAGSASLSNGTAHAVVWLNGRVSDLGTLGADWSAAMSINGSGQSTGTSLMGDGAFEAFFAPSTGSMRAIGTLGGRSSYGMDMNENGEVVGSAQTATGYSHAFSWAADGLRDLGTLGGTQSYAYGVNNSGAVVGYSYTADGSTHGLLYSDGVLLDLNGLLPISSGWTVTEAFAINHAGVIAGIGLHNGVEHAVLLTPNVFGDSPQGHAPSNATPEPRESGLFGLGLVLVGCLSALARLARRIAARVPPQSLN